MGATYRKHDFSGDYTDILARMRLVIGLAGAIPLLLALQQGRAQTPEKPVAVSLCDVKAHPENFLHKLIEVTATASHGFLDAFTNGGLGVALFAPFDHTRYFFPIRPILVSPLNLSAFGTRRGAAVLFSEMQWVWLPSIAIVVPARIWRCRDSVAMPPS